MFCGNCGNKLEDGDKFCGKCGNVQKQDNDESKSNLEKSKTKPKLNKKVILPLLGVGICALVFLLVFTFSSDKIKKLFSSSSETSVNVNSGNMNSKASKPADSKISINQIDSSNFPEISVYFTAEDGNGAVLKNLTKNYMKIKESNSKNSVDEEILDLRQMNLNQPLSINLVMDTSDSMSGNKIDIAKTAARNFINSVQFNSGDLVELITFNQSVSIAQGFTSQKDRIDGVLKNLSTNSETAFYDALNTSLVETSEKNGPKCIIAFTDGLDNKSKVTSEYVADLGKKLGIPIYIIGIGDDVDTNVLRDISEKTGGYFTHISDVEKLQQIYSDIFKKQKQQYILKYKTKNNVRDGIFRNVDLNLISERYVGSASESYLPKYAINPNVDPSTGYSSQYEMTGVERAMYDYQYNFVKAVNGYDFSVLSPYIDANGALYNMQQKLIESYKKQSIQEKLVYYSIESSKKVNNDEYQLVVYEKFYITYGNKKPTLMEYRNIYTIKNTSNGFKVSDMPDLKVLNSTSVNYNF